MVYFKAHSCYLSGETEENPANNRAGSVPTEFEGFISRIQVRSVILLKPTGHVMHQQVNIQQLYVLLTLYLCVLYLSENKQRLVLLTA